MSERKRSLLLLTLAIAVTAVFFSDVCGLVFDCGCRSLWNGAAEACNIHLPHGPQCPWCAHPIAGGAVAFLSTVALQSFVLLLRSSPVRLGVRFVLALAAFPAVSALLGAFHAWLWGY